MMNNTNSVNYAQIGNQVGRDLQIPTQFDVLQKEIENLGAAVESLTMRLKNVTTESRPVGVEKANPIPVAPMCEYATNLQRKSEQIHHIYEMVAGLEKSLEL